MILSAYTNSIKKNPFTIRLVWSPRTPNTEFNIFSKEWRAARYAVNFKIYICCTACLLSRPKYYTALKMCPSYDISVHTWAETTYPIYHVISKWPVGLCHSSIWLSKKTGLPVHQAKYLFWLRLVPSFLYKYKSKLVYFENWSHRAATSCDGWHRRFLIFSPIRLRYCNLFVVTPDMMGLRHIDNFCEIVLHRTTSYYIVLHRTTSYDSRTIVLRWHTNWLWLLGEKLEHRKIVRHRTKVER